MSDLSRRELCRHADLAALNSPSKNVRPPHTLAEHAKQGRVTAVFDCRAVERERGGHDVGWRTNAIAKMYRFFFFCPVPRNLEMLLAEWHVACVFGGDRVSDVTPTSRWLTVINELRRNLSPRRP